MSKTTPAPVEFRPMTGLNEPSINLFLIGEIERQVLMYPNQRRVITAVQVSQALNEAVILGIKLGHLATKETTKQPRVKKTPSTQEATKE